MLFYSKEVEIVEKSLELVNEYCTPLSDREKIKKSYEAFHFLTFLKAQKVSYEHIEPHEPGDFIIFDPDGRKHLYEILTVFGYMENIEVKKKLRSVFIGHLSYLESNQYDPIVMPKLFMRCLNKKNAMPYFNKKHFETINLLVVTSEFTRCSNCGLWFLRENQKELTEFIPVKNFDKLFFIDYAASGLDGDPITGDLEEELKILNECIPLDV